MYIYTYIHMYIYVCVCVCVCECAYGRKPQSTVLRVQMSSPNHISQQILRCLSVPTYNPQQAQKHKIPRHKKRLLC